MRYNLLAKCEVEGTSWLFVVPWEKGAGGWIGSAHHAHRLESTETQSFLFCFKFNIPSDFFFCDVVYISSAALFSEVSSCHQWYLSLYLEG